MLAAPLGCWGGQLEGGAGEDTEERVLGRTLRRGAEEEAEEGYYGGHLRRGA